MKAEFDMKVMDEHILGVISFPEGFSEQDATIFMEYLLENWELEGTELVGSIVHKENKNE